MSPGDGQPELALRRAVSDNWPYTSRAMPWALAAFLTLVWLVPIDAVDVKVSLPVDSKIDRFAIVVLVLAWMLFGGDRRPRGRRPAAFLVAVGVWVGVAFLSLIVNVPRVIRLGEFELSQKQLALLVAFGVFAWFATAALRPDELRAFSVLTVVLGTICAVGVIVERKTGYNAFYEISRTILSPIANVGPSPTVINPDPLRFDRPQIVGPTEHGLAVTTMLSIAVPFAVLALLDARNHARKLVYGLCVALMLTAALSTERKTGIVVPVVVVIALLVYRGRDLLRLWPLVFVFAVFIHVTSPGALGTITSLNGFLNTDSSAGRTSDYAAVMPDVVTRPLLGFGYGSLDVARADTYRILDNEYLGQLLQSGVIGVAAFLAISIAAVAVARPAARSLDPARASPALASLAAVVGFAVASALFDILSFPQPVYLFLFAGAMCTAAATGLPGREPARVRTRAPTPDRGPAGPAIAPQPQPHGAPAVGWGSPPSASRWWD